MQAVSEIKYFYKILGHPDPCISELVAYSLDGIKEICCHAPQNKTPITAERLQKLYRNLGGKAYVYFFTEKSKTFIKKFQNTKNLQYIDTAKIREPEETFSVREICHSKKGVKLKKRSW